MILIAISWIYILFTTVNFGFAFRRLLKLNADLVVTSILGLFSITILASFWAIFGRINYEFHIGLLFLNGVLLLSYRHQIVTLYKGFISQARQFEKNLKILLLTISVLIIAQCATVPFIIDNESYYIPTIKWLNEFGLVKGLGNLHLYLAQTSGWHITQSVFNFSFLYDKFNDLSGFCLLLGNLFAFQKLDQYFKTKDFSFLAIGLFPLANILLFQFISTPSPDIPIYAFSFIIFSFLLENQKKMDTEIFSTIAVLVLFCIYIKTTAAALCLFPVLIIIQDIKKIRVGKIVLVSAAVLALFIIKNTVITGHPFFPIIKKFDGLALDYQIPENIARLYYKAAAFHTTESDENKGITQLFWNWITLPKLHGLFNKLGILIAFLSPLILFRFLNEKRYWMLYLVMLVQLIVLLWASPQYRFFLNFILLFSFLFMALLIRSRKSILVVNYIVALITAFILFVPVHIGGLANNEYSFYSSTFSYQNVIFPYQNSKYESDFRLVRNGNLNYYSPRNIDFFWGIGDCPLPSAKKECIDYFETKYGVRPQMRTDALKDGFFAKKIATTTR